MAGDDVRELTRQFDVLSERLRALEDRVVRLESHDRDVAADAAEPAETDTSVASDVELNMAGLALSGRTLIVLGGGFLLRMLTDAGILPKLGGVLIGLAYALAWLILADRDAAGHRRASAFFHGLAAALVAYPLIWETTARFKLLAPEGAAFALAAVTVSSLVVSARGKLGSLVWTAAIFAVMTTASLALRTHDVMPFAAFLAAMVVATEWLALRELSAAVRWLPALTLDGFVLVMTQLLLRSGGLPEGFAPFSRFETLALAHGLIVVHLTSTVIRGVALRRSLSAFDVVQTGLATLVGFAALGLLSPAGSVLRLFFGSAALFTAAGCYVTAFGVVRPRDGLVPAFFHFSSAAAALGLFGSYAVLGGRVASTAWLVIGVVVIWLGARRDRITLRYHGSAYLVVGALGERIVGGFSDGMLAAARNVWTPIPPGAVVAFVSTSIGYAVLVRYALGHAPEDEPRLQTLPRLALASLVGWTLACAAARFLGTTLGVAQVPDADAALLATVRTAVLAALAIGCAGFGRRLSLRELRWLVWPTLAVAGVKLLHEDFRHGRPLTLCLALVFFGAALIVVPRLLRRASPDG